MSKYTHTRPADKDGLAEQLKEGKVEKLKQFKHNGFFREKREYENIWANKYQTKDLNGEHLLKP